MPPDLSVSGRRDGSRHRAVRHAPEEAREIRDNGGDRMAQDIKDIARTRVAITEKLGAIE
jgi:hypothetical protein